MPFFRILTARQEGRPYVTENINGAYGILAQMREYTIKKRLFGDGMKKSLRIWQLFGFALTSLGGTLLHFSYEWTGGSVLVAPFSGVNESTWEHMKLLFFPMLIFAVVEGLFFREWQGFWWMKLYGILFGLMLIPVLFYTYNGVIGKSPDWINISIFFISAALAYIFEVCLAERGRLPQGSKRIPQIILAAIALFFVVFTFVTPKINIFKDPITGGYGIE